MAERGVEILCAGTELLLEDFKAGNISSSDKEFKFISRTNGEFRQEWIQDWAASAKQHLNTCDDAFTRSAVMTTHQNNNRETTELMSLWQATDASTELYLMKFKYSL